MDFQTNGISYDFVHFFVSLCPEMKIQIHSLVTYIVHRTHRRIRWIDFFDEACNINRFPLLR